MPRSTLDRRLVRAILLLFLAPTLAVGLVLALLYRRGLYEDDPVAVALTVAVGFVTMMAYLGVVAYALGRSIVRTLAEIRLGTELMATVNPDHRIRLRTGDELEALAAEINRMADQVRDAQRGLASEVADATRQLAAERETLAQVLEALGEGALLATPEGRVTLANRAAQALFGTGLVGVNLFDLVDREKVALFLQRLRGSGSAAERFTLHPAAGGVLETVMTPLGGAEGGLRGVILLVRDVTRPAHVDEARRRLVADALRELRDPTASIRSLSETLLADPGGSDRRPLEAIHAEAVRLSGLVRRLDDPGVLGIGQPTRHLEELSAADLAAMVRRRLEPEGTSIDVEAVGEDVPPLRAEVSALSGALARLARAVLARRAAGGRAWLRVARLGHTVQIDVGAEGPGRTADLEALLDAAPDRAPGGDRAVREVVREHAGEAWSYAEANRLGFRVTLPAAEPGAPPDEGGPGARRAPVFVGAGMTSGVEPGRREPDRPEFYDFSLLEEVARDLSAHDRDRPLRTLACVAFDTETTGLHPEAGDRIVSIAGVRIRGGTVRRGEVFDALVNPGRPVPAESIRFHGITDAMVAGAPGLDVVLPAFLRFAEDAVLVGHEVSFDLSVLAVETRRLGLAPMPARHGVLDTLLLSEVAHGPLGGHWLEDIAERLGVVVRGRHSALGDALATAEILARLIPLLERRGIRTLGEAIEAMGRIRRRGGHA